MTGEVSETLAGLRRPRTRHDPRGVQVDLVVAVADAVEAISNVGVQGDQPIVRAGGVGLHGLRLLEALGELQLVAVAGGGRWRWSPPGSGQQVEMGAPR